ncbi:MULTISPECIES: thioredoxin family protein [Bacillus cereus group]|uniref:thioredoxin family protein n=1 Tax=Bacillus cereus group TaxID=86661 RepID=UPI0007FB3827|nr:MULTISPECIES: thioredoxin family protein [Bacillus cereus group]MCP1399287.1 putative bacteriocin transport accessory protein [Bacillus cereus]OBW84853.1 thiol reductase thioredoxin [Bacillus cereus]PEV60862.1 thioredoxin [Bacillus thuringiensis]PFC41773.1 thioredoxin [Bacillus thuringiensis]PFF27582.1 thioredoxin [Bacillus thuringiensis]
MKKIYKIGAVVTTLCVACIVIFTLTKNESVNPETVTPNKTIVSAAETKGSPENIKDISKEELKQKIQSHEEFIAYYYQPTCHYCKKAAPDINRMSKKHDRTIYRIDISTSVNQSAFQEFHIPGTPVVVAYNRGEEIERLEGAVSAATYDGFFARRNSSAS